MQWPAEFYAWRAGDGCPACADGRPEETPWGVRFFAGAVSDAYLVRADVQRGLSVAVWRGRHVAEPTELTDAEAAAYGREVLLAGRAIEAAFAPVKLNYDVLGNSLPHLHTHIVPRYADDPRPGWPFPFPDPDPGPMPDERLAADVAALRVAVGVPSGARPGRTIPALPARDVAAAAAFYAERLGFAVRHHDTGFAIVVRDGAEVHLWEAGDEGWRQRENLREMPVCSGAESFIAGTASCRIEVVGVDALFAELRDKGVLHKVSLDGVTATDFGTRELNALDADGNLLTFYETSSARRV